MFLDDLLKKYERDGYIVLKKAMLKNECKKLIKKTLIPILHKKHIYLTKPESWKENNTSDINHGKLIYGSINNNTHIIPRYNKHFRFSALYNSKKLNNFINTIHSRKTKCVKINKWNYNFLAKEGLGWIHLRFPCYNYENKEIDTVKCPENSFHLDGLNHKNEINSSQSVVLLPFINTVHKNCGGTAVIPGSHKLINNHILRHNYKTNKNTNIIVDKIVKNNNNNFIDVTGEQGDILIMHPHLIHSPSLADINSKVRITFNLSTEKS